MNALTRRLAVPAAVIGLLSVAMAPAAQASSLKGWEQDALHLEDAHRKSTGKGVTVAVLDSGVLPAIPAVKGHVKTGKDFVNNGTKRGSPHWGGSGTARASNVLQIAPEARILSVRVGTDPEDKGKKPDFQGRDNPMTKGILYAADHGADVITIPFGTVGSGPEDFDKFTVDALAYAAHKNIPVLAAAGSGEQGDAGLNPAGYGSAIAVTASGKDGARTPYSAVRMYNAVAAPGHRIKSATPTGGFTFTSGPGTAAAVASGVTALALSENPDLTPAQVRALLIRSTGSKEFTPPLGHGTINAEAAVNSAASPPAARTGVVEHQGRPNLGRPDGTSRFLHPDLDTGVFYTGIAVAGVGLAMLVGAMVVAVRSRNGSPRAAAPVPPW